MTTNQNRPGFDDELRELAEVAIDLHEGRGGPAKYRHAPSGGCALPSYGKPSAGYLTLCFGSPYTMHQAMTFAGLVLYGVRFDEAYVRLGLLPGDLSDAYQELERTYGKAIKKGGAKTPPSLAEALTAPPVKKARFVTMSIPARPALPNAPASTRTALPFTTPRISLPDK